MATTVGAMSQRGRTIAWTVLKFTVPVVLILWLLWRVEPEQWETLRERPKDYPLLAAALLAALAALCVSFFRWWTLVRCQGISLGLVEAFRLGAIGFLLSFVSAGSVGGDLFKMIFLARRNPGKGIEAVASVVVDRGVGLLGLLIVVAAAMSGAGVSGNPELAKIGNAALGLTGIGMAVLATLVFGGRPIDAILQRAARWRYLGGAINRIAGPLRVFHRYPLVFAAALGLSLSVHALMAVSAYWIARGLYGDLAPSLGEHLLIVSIANLAAALPIAPAGVGVLEAAMEWLYRVVPAEPTTASGTLVALVFEIVKVVMGILGLVFYWTAGREVRRSLAALKADASADDDAETSSTNNA